MSKAWKMNRKAGDTTLAKNSAGAQLGAFWGTPRKPAPRFVVIRHCAALPETGDWIIIDNSKPQFTWFAVAGRYNTQAEAQADADKFNALKARKP